MKRLIGLLVLGFCLAWGFFVPRVWTQNLPDLTVVRISAIPQGFECRIEAEVVNLGPGEIPQEEFNQAEIRFYRDNVENGYSLRYVDSEGVLRQPRGDVVVRAPGRIGFLAPGETAHIRVVIDPLHQGSIHEANEQNNSLERDVTCNIPLPDVAVTKIYAVKQGDDSCEVWTEIKNLGPGRVNPEEENHAGIKFYKNGGSDYYYTFPYVDSHNELENSGGTINFPLPLEIRELRPGEQATFRVHADFNNITIHEITKSNNDVTQTVKCDPLPDLAVTRIFLQQVSRGCQLKAEIKNLGGQIRDEAFRSIRVYFAVGNSHQTLKLSEVDHQWVLQNGGGSLIVNFPVGGILPPGNLIEEATIKLDTTNIQSELNENNNFKSQKVLCPLANPGPQRIPQRRIQIPRSISPQNLRR